MDFQAANNIINSFRNTVYHSDQEAFQYIEALEYLINVQKSPFAMIELGSYYYETKQFDLALKYYELASMNGILSADTCLGYIWYYGRTGTVDYEKAFKYYSKAMEHGDEVSTYKIADMYKNGYYVDKDYNKYKAIINKMYNNSYRDALPEVKLRYGEIHLQDEDKSKALEALESARGRLMYRIDNDAFFGDFTNMRWCINMLYEISYIDFDNLDIFDIYELFKLPFEKPYPNRDCSRYFSTNKISFLYEENEYIVEAYEEDDGTVSVKFEDRWYRTVDDFLMKAEIDGIKICQLAYEIEDVKIA